ncbi:MAG: alpha/beta hydrolase-fold protein, partial [Acidobacteriota bacterium]
TGDFRYHKNFHSQFLAKDRDIIVYLPPGYTLDTSKRYSVLYLHDGQNLFDGATSFIPNQEWRIDETAQSLILANMIEPIIIVGIYNAGEQRVDEYTPSKETKYNAGGKADLYGRMLVEELKPFIDANYRTLTDTANTGLGGSSLGGLVSLYLGLKYPNVFGKLAVVSPSIWWDDKFILKQVQTLKTKPALHIWLDMGTEEGGTSLQDTQLLRDALVAKGWSLDKDLKYFEASSAKHNETAWAQRVEPILKYLFPNKQKLS